MINNYLNLRIDLDRLKQINLTELSNYITNQEYKGYFLSKEGTEHYKLLAYFSTLYENSILLDVGTNRGCSSLAMAYNSTNKVESFDLYELKELSGYPSNINYHIGNVTDTAYSTLVKESKCILLDTEHDGIFETEFYNYLRAIKWEGVLLLDDIKLNDKMIRFWSNIVEEKYDITHLGHATGTGMVVFSKNK